MRYFFFCCFIYIIAGCLFPTPSQVPQIIPAPDSEAIKFDDSFQRIPLTQYRNMFIGHNAETIFKNLQTLIAQKKIKDSAVYGKLTVDDYFVFADYYFNPTQSVRAVSNADKDVIFQGSSWRLRPADEFPEPRIVYVSPCGMGGGSGGDLPKVAKRDELFQPAAAANDASFWMKHVFYLETRTSKTKRTDYEGDGVGKQCEEKYIPLRQTHYVLAFDRAQPYRLFDSSQYLFSLDEYGYRNFKSPGIVSWSGSDVLGAKPPYTRPLFVVKLTPPYIRTKTFTVQDKIEGKPHIATQNQLVGDLVGIWLYDSTTGQIVSRDAADRIK